MKLRFKIVDAFQITGFTISTAVSIILIFANVDPVLSTILGLLLAALVQLFDFQLRLGDTEGKLLQANALSQQLYSDEWLLGQVRKLVDDYMVVKNSWYEPFFLCAKDSLIVVRHYMSCQKAA